MTQPFQNELQTALRAVRQAAIVCRSVQSAITTESLAKKDKSPVTVADFASQAIVCRQLLHDFPDDPVIGEEGAAELKLPTGADFLDRIVSECTAAGTPGSAQEICDWIDRGGASQFSPRFWTLDPIDGTKGFLRKEQYAIALALIIDGKISVGVLGCPNMPLDGKPEGTGVLAWAVRGMRLDAAFVRFGCRSGPDLCSHSADTAAMRFCESVESGHSSHDWSGLIATELGIHLEPVRMDSQCKYLAVARGDADLYLRLPTRKGYQEKIWDHAAGILLVLEAGGTVTDINGRVPDFQHGASLTQNEGMVVTNGRAHPTIVAAIGKHAPADMK